MDFPRSVEDVTKDWLCQNLGVVHSDALGGMSMSPLGNEQGASAQLYRADLDWRATGDLPLSLVFKFASDQETFREYAKTMGTYLKEVRFYQTLGTNTALPIPLVYFADIDESSNDFLIVMEDLAGGRMSTWFADGVSDVKLGLSALASIHAKYWGQDSLSGFTWLGQADDRKQSDQYRNILAQILPTAKEKFGNLLSDYSWSVLQSWLENWEQVRQATSTGTKTLVHREADMRQMFFPTHQVDRFVLFDWQSPEIGWGAADACRLMVTSLNLAGRRQHEHELVSLYINKLRENGVSEISGDTLWYQIKLSLLMNVLAHMFSLLWVETQETAVWQHKHLSILGSALEDWDLLDVISSTKG